jgi:hypothetical protein
MSQNYGIIGDINATNVSVGDNKNQTYIQNERQYSIETIDEIEHFLEHLERINLMPEKHKKINESGVKLTPRERLISALKSGGETAIDELVLENKYHKIVKSIVKGWLSVG